MKDLISIVVPMYNCENYITKCIETILIQTYSNIEVILIDDGSDDNTYSICSKIIGNDKRVKLIRKKNSGVSDTRNIGIENSMGKYITFIDADDYVSNDYIETLYNNMIKYNADIIMSNAIDIKNEKKIYNYRVLSDIVFDKKNCLKSLFSEKEITSTCWGKLFKTSNVKQIKFDSKMKIAEDFKFLVDIINHSNKIAVVPVYKYYYVLTENSAIRSGFNNNWLDEFNYCESLINIYKNTELEKIAIKRYIRPNVSCAINFNLNKKELQIIKNNIKKYKKDYIFNKYVSLKDKIKYIFVYYFYWLRKWVKFYEKSRNINY